MDILRIIFISLEVVLLFNLLIFVHELGHYLAARWRGLKVERFAIWFGKPIFKTTRNGVEFALGWIPAGGYVSLPQMAPMDVIEGKSEENDKEPLPPISAADKIIVAFAGPLFSFLLAVAFAVIVWQVGKPELSASEDSTVVGWVEPGGPAWKSGLRPGDLITEVDGEKVTAFAPPSQASITWRVVTSTGTNIAVKYLRDGREAMAYPVPYKRPTKWYERKALRQILIGSAHPVIVYEIATNSPAAKAGLRAGDEILALNSEKIFNAQPVLSVAEAMTNGAPTAVTFTIRRGKEEIKQDLTPARPLSPAGSKPSFGILSWLGNTNIVMSHPSPSVQIKAGVSQIIATLGAIFAPKSDIGVQQLGGAIMIFRVYSGLFQNEHGWRLALWFSVVMNVNLAMLNMLPLPVLDGGHITLALIEAVRRRPASGKVLQYIQTAFAVALITFMLFIAFFDTGDWVRSARRDRKEAEPIVFAP
ncbi:MAG: RIP metalloprotease RseP [Verrucomicrobia bacterium]|nr:RIP metalloprotease RseP [Verrucomicrobiota bacterium]